MPAKTPSSFLGSSNGVRVMCRMRNSKSASSQSEALSLARQVAKGSPVGVWNSGSLPTYVLRKL